MKKLYFLNEEESKRILNLHKDASKRQYLKEQEVTSVPTYGVSPSTDKKPFSSQEYYQTPTTDIYKKPSDYFDSKFTPSSGTTKDIKTKTNSVPVVPCPVGKGTKPEVMAFQDWLDDNKKGWLPKYPDGLNSEVKKGYGLCGPNTRRAWSDTTLQSMYLAGQTNNPETMTAKKVSTTIQEPSQERELKLSTTNTSTGTPVASTTVATADTKVATAAQPNKTPFKDDEVAVDDDIPDAEKF